MDYKKYILSQGGKEIGLSFADIRENILAPEQYRRFEYFMRGQTFSSIGGISICHTDDFDRFIKDLPVID